MANHYSVFVRPARSGDDPLELVGKRFGWKFAQSLRIGGLLAIAEPGMLFVDYFPDHDFEDDGVARFSRYDSYFRLRGNYPEHAGELRAAQAIFDTLVESGMFACALIYNLSSVLAEHSSASSDNHHG